jgi:LysM repeat protein
LDYQAWENRRKVPARQRVCLTNGIRMVRAVEGETLSEIALSCSEDIAAVIEYNENHWGRNEPLTHGTPIYLGSKQSEWRDSDLEFFFVHEGMHIFEISQLFGVREGKIREMNGLAAKQEPAMKSKVRVSGKRMANEKMATTTSKIKTRVPAQPRNRKPPIPPVKSDYPINSSNMYRLNQILDSQYTARLSTVSNIGMIAASAPTPTPAATSDNSGKRLLASQKKAEPTPEFRPASSFHEVTKGDTLAAVARKYGVTITDLRKMNNLAQDTIKIGQRLRVK